LKELRVTIELSRSFTCAGSIEAKELSQLFPDMTISVLARLQQGQRDLYHLNLNCRDLGNDQIINELVIGIQKLGYSIVEAKLVEIANGALEGLLMGGLSGLGVSAKSKESSAKLVASCVGMAVGAWLGHNVTWEKTIHEMRWNPTAGWHWILIRAQVWPSPEQFLSPILALKA
jgi:hypothetical protein